MVAMSKSHARPRMTWLKLIDRHGWWLAALAVLIIVIKALLGA